MPHRQKHRGAHPKDAELFALAQVPSLQEAAGDLQWLLSRGYAPNAATKLVGDRFSLRQRQRMALTRSVCTFSAAQNRLQKGLTVLPPLGTPIWVDGFNILITVETWLSKGLLLQGQDSAYRDLASIHGSYHRVEETDQSLQYLGQLLGDYPVQWYFDQPVSNSGRLAQRVRDLAAENQWNWTVFTDFNPDQRLIESGALVVSTDALILDACKNWLNVMELLLKPEKSGYARQLVTPWLVSFYDAGLDSSQKMYEL